MITYSTDTGKQSIKDYEFTRKIAIKEFGTSTDKNQWHPTEEDSVFVMNNLPECMNIIRDDDNFIGFTLIIPSTRELMDNFINKEINENDLWLAAKNRKVTLDNFSAIYLCSAIIDKNYRRRGLSSNGFVKSIRKLIGKKNVKPILFYWAYSNEGKLVADKVAKILNLKLEKRIE